MLSCTQGKRRVRENFLKALDAIQNKAIDLVDEAGSRLRMEIDSMPVEIDEATRQLTRMQIEAAALDRETSEESRERLKDLKRQIAEREESTSQLKAQWETEKAAISETPSAVECESGMRT